MARAQPRVFTIEPGQGFARIIAERLIDGTLTGTAFGSDPLALADVRVFVPTRRFRPALEAALAEVLYPRPAVLPRIHPLAEPTDPLEAMVLDPVDLPVEALVPAITPMRRQFKLLPMVIRWRDLVMREAGLGRATSFKENLVLAQALGALIDEFRIADVPLETLALATPPGYDPARHDEYWQRSREFLAIAAQYWPEALREAGVRDAMDLRLTALVAEAERLARSDFQAPCFVVGSTGSIPAVRALMRVVARLDRGAVILPGLDLGLDEAGWAAIGDKESSIPSRFGHPQAMLKKTLEAIGLARADVGTLAAINADGHARNRAVSEAMRPAETVGAWRATIENLDLDSAFKDVTLVEAVDEREEALAIAVLIRKAVADGVPSIALVTPDRRLAARVRVDLARWGLRAADTAGIPLRETPAGVFLRLILTLVQEDRGVQFLALARHPLFRLGFSRDDAVALADALDLLVFRERRFTAGMPLAERVRHALSHPPERPHPAAKRIPEAIQGALPAYAKAFDDALAPFRRSDPARLVDLGADVAATAMLFSQDEAGESLLATTSDGAILIDLIAEIGAEAGETLVSPREIGGLFETFLAERVVPPASGESGRIAIMGVLESRLLAPDHVIVGGLNEGVFPPVAREDPFLNRAMRHALGLPPPERRIGQSAHDFVMLAGNRHLALTRARRMSDQPSLPSRFLRRIEALAGAAIYSAMRNRGEAILALARRIDRPGPYMPLSAPAPVPLEPRLPSRLSITEIETLRRDPYTLYARHILGLEPLGAIEPEPGARERGTILHACLDTYCRGDPPRDSLAAEQALREIGARLFAPIAKEQELFQFWWRAFERIIPGFVAFDRERRDQGWKILTEIRGTKHLALSNGGEIALSGKADRIEIAENGAFSVFDYKSSVPRASQVRAGLSPQLLITAALVERGAFPEARKVRNLDGLGYVPIGGRKPVRPEWVTPGKNGTIGDLVRADWERLEAELGRFARGEEAYRAQIAPLHRDQPGDYDHLARIREWGLAGAGEDGEEET